MAREEKFTQKWFMAAYERSLTMLALTRELKCSVPTLYRYLRKFKLPPLPGPVCEPQPPLLKRVRLPKHNPVDLARRYRWQATVEQIARENGLTPGILKYYLKMLIHKPKRFYLSKSLKPPLKICHIKIINHLITHPKDKDTNPRDFVYTLGLTNRQINDYWHYAYGLRVDDYPVSSLSTLTSKQETPEEIYQRNLRRLKEEKS